MVSAGWAAPDWMQESMRRMEKELAGKAGNAQLPAIQRGLRQVSQLWQTNDGNAAQFEHFVRENYAADTATRDALYARLQRLCEKMDGHMTELRYELKRQTDLDLGTVLSADEIFSAYDPGAHLCDDLFNNKIASVVLLNFPLTTLDQRLNEGDKWTRRQWGEVRLAQRFSKRIPSDVFQGISDAQSEAELYINEYKICMHHLVDAKGERLFPPKLRLITHWNLRDEIKGQYRNASQEALPRQRMIQQVMERIIDQSIPACVINDPRVDWNPFNNEVRASAVQDIPALTDEKLAIVNTPEGDVRYAKLLNVFQACRKADPYSPSAPSLIARRFEEDRQMSEARVKSMLEQLLRSPEYAATGRLIEKRLGRPLEPFDIWFNGLAPKQNVTEAQLDAIVSKRYPDARSFHAGMMKFLPRLQFSKERVAFLQQNIDVESSRGTGHAMGGTMRGQKARLRTRIEKEGMNYKGYNIALHELGHNIEQTYSLNLVDDILLQGVPNNSFTEAFAMLLQGHDLELLDMKPKDPDADALRTLNEFWATCEIAGMGLVDIEVWHWMYQHPQATPAELKAATLKIARDLWNQYHAPVFHKQDVILLAVYSHMIRDILYLPDYTMGHLIAFQIDEQMRKAGNFGREFERMAAYGNVAPDLWMKHATGSAVGADAMITAAREALKKISGK